MHDLQRELDRLLEELAVLDRCTEDRDKDAPMKCAGHSSDLPIPVMKCAVINRQERLRHVERQLINNEAK